MKTPSSNGSSRTCPWTRLCSRTSFKKSSETRQAARSHAVLDGTLRRQHTARLRCDQGNAIVSLLPEPKGSADGVAPAGAAAGASARPLRLSTSAGLVVTRRLGGWERALLSRVYRGRPGAAAETPVA